MNIFISILYELVLLILALLYIPKLIYMFFKQKKYRTSFFYKLGMSVPTPQKKQLPSIWIHAVSVGETHAIVSVARELKNLFPHHALIISSTTETGHREAKRCMPFADFHTFLPFDFKWCVYKAIKKTSPGLVILCESDFWFNFLNYSKKQGAAIVLVNGKMSEKSMKNYRFFSFFSKKLFDLFDLLCVQNSLYAQRFIETGVNPDKIVTTGNLKLDVEHPKLTVDEINEWRQKLGITSNQMVLTIGSSHDPEEKNLIEVIKKIWVQNPALKVIIVPRHPERFKIVAEFLEKERLNWIAFSDISRRTGQEQVILMDAMGLLRMCYQLSNMAIVCGSFTNKVGGHNIIEPCWYGVPVLFGPHMFTQQELVNIMLHYDAGHQIEMDKVEEVILKWIKNEEERKKIGENGLRLIQNLRGTTKRTLEAMKPFYSTLKGSY
ncbi:MAG: glycosyltransferase N-terminal domain-containing protein [Parachlamydiaceae bacterium]|nr:glycosyltransferase N-terminal domain-containing protein [Parachlamydiaceae bacterium]